MFKYSANYVLIAGLSVVDTVVAFVYSTLLLSYDVCCLHNAYAHVGCYLHYVVIISCTLQ